jgi:hypothetical protein
MLVTSNRVTDGSTEAMSCVKPQARRLDTGINSSGDTFAESSDNFKGAGCDPGEFKHLNRCAQCAEGSATATLPNVPMQSADHGPMIGLEACTADGANQDFDVPTLIVGMGFGQSLGIRNNSGSHSFDLLKPIDLALLEHHRFSVTNP